MDLIDDIHLISAGLGSEADLLYQGADIVDAIVTGGIEFVYIEGGTFVKRDAGVTFITGFPVLVGRFAIDGLGEDTGTGGLAYPTWTAEEESVC
jgi:hypothetical protein